MSVLVVGVSHHSAPVAVLERLALDADAAQKLVVDVVGAEHVTEATVISTCNRLEVYTDVERFHGSIEAISRMLIERAGATTDAMLPHLYVHYDDAAVSHLFRVTAGLDSMVVGEGQILGQAREALRLGQELGTVGPALNVLFQQALRVGKRAHAETEIDRAAPSLVSAALEIAAPDVGGLAGRRAVIVGAGSMASLAAASLSRAGASEIVLVNRTPGNAERLAGEYGARVAPLADLERELVGADVVVSCTGATGTVLTRDLLARARTAEADPARPTTVVDLALPHDVEPAVADLPGITLRGLARLAEELRVADVAPGIDAVRDIVTEEISAFTSARRQASVTPTVVALRTMATTVVDTEMARLDGRLPDLDPAARAEVLQTVRRVADKLLHQPTVRVKQLANEEGAVSYAAALAELFALDPDAVDAVTRPGGRP
ncbi:glutamyl-tRNA reductase [Nocardioides zeae]|uniref:Glutamyl-tRNA reductase n=1 Tax=Nocardioides imazamoxiresistens TaxID=3231893 RepID=A0ABU3PZX4_9ACTN|nr:glutamyl-tRNA reductase [Nocardioides zeae]MDT9594806.1 glutamyl-tRNA reductase [Nocardioides zeae]